ncbi:MAG: hypothetical protein LBJ25_01915 [Candidatus Margulisbacteria bacterium]|nr:hypothetical protein [Candidatus Margulisiibacteriota bacterium]
MNLTAQNLFILIKLKGITEQNFGVDIQVRHLFFTSRLGTGLFLGITPEIGADFIPKIV